jgi:hypothetical protein
MLLASKKSSTPGLTPSAPNAALPPKLNPDLDAVCACTFDHYPWDDWHRHALARGLDDELAGLGRLLIREAFNHDWPGWLKIVCGWSDDGQALLAFALPSRRGGNGTSSCAPTACAAIILHAAPNGRGAFSARTRGACWRLSTLNPQPSTTDGLAHS